MPLENSWTPVIRAGKVLNKGLTNILDTWHKGTLSNDSLSGLTLDAPNVMVSALKRSEDGKRTILRMYETDGIATDFSATGCCLPCPLSGHIDPWALQTWYCPDGSTQWQQVLVTEYPCEA